jgi:hypothetical protein
VTRLNYYNYFTEIEDVFIRRRGKNLFLSPIDWALMETWHDREIPLHVVIRGIEQVFDNFEKNPSPRTIKGLMFCREEVEAQHDEWLKSQAGKTSDADEVGEEHSLEFICEHIVGLVESLHKVDRPELAEDLERACSRLGEIKDNLNNDHELLDRSLSDVEHLLDEALLKKTNRETFKSIEREVVEQLRPYKGTMDKEAYGSTLRLMLLKRLREELDVPRLSLFYL